MAGLQTLLAAIQLFVTAALKSLLLMPAIKDGKYRPCEQEAEKARLKYEKREFWVMKSLRKGQLNDFECYTLVQPNIVVLKGTTNQNGPKLDHPMRSPIMVVEFSPLSCGKTPQGRRMHK